MAQFVFLHVFLYFLTLFFISKHFGGIFCGIVEVMLKTLAFLARILGFLGRFLGQRVAQNSRFVKPKCGAKRCANSRFFGQDLGGI